MPDGIGLQSSSSANVEARQYPQGNAALPWRRSVYAHSTFPLYPMDVADCVARDAVVSMHRKAMKDITLYDGTEIPKGTVVSTNVHPQHHDAAILENAGMFDAFRYARMRSVEGQSLKHQFTSTSPEYIAFGYGPRAWCVCVLFTLRVQVAGPFK